MNFSNNSRLVRREIGFLLAAFIFLSWGKTFAQGRELENIQKLFQTLGQMSQKVAPIDGTQPTEKSVTPGVRIGTPSSSSKYTVEQCLNSSRPRVSINQNATTAEEMRKSAAAQKGEVCQKLVKLESYSDWGASPHCFITSQAEAEAAFGRGKILASPAIEPTVGPQPFIDKCMASLTVENVLSFDSSTKERYGRLLQAEKMLQRMPSCSPNEMLTRRNRPR